MKTKRTLTRTARPKQQTAKPKQIAITAHLQQLESGLKEANAQLKESGREAAIAALQAVMEFIDSVHALSDQNLGTSIWTLLAALEDLNHGRVVAMLAPTRKVPSRRPDPSIRKVVKAYASCCVDVLRKADLSIPEACRVVAKELKGAGFALGGRQGTPDWRIVEGWRDRVTKLPATDHERETLEGLRKEIPRLKFYSVDDAKNFVIGQMRELLETIGKPALE